MRSDGFTLIELLVILAFLGVILLIATPLTLENIRRARAENQIQTIYSNVAEARQRALQRSINYLIQVKSDSVYVYEDRNRNNTADTGEKVDVLSADGLPYKLVGTVGSSTIGTTARTATANPRGYVQPTVSMYVDKASPGASTTEGPQEGPHNCILIDFTRVSIGKYNGTSCQVQ